jgi:hypothetical protein
MGQRPVLATGTSLATDKSGQRYAAGLAAGLSLLAVARFGNSRLWEKTNKNGGFGARQIDRGAALKSCD